MKESLEQVKKKLKSLDDPNFDQATQMRTLVGLMALASMLLPWIRLDGHSETMNGAQMIAYAFTDPGRASIFGISKLGTLAVLLVPILALAASAYGFFRLAQGHHSLASHQGNRVLLSFLNLFKIVIIMTKLGRGSDGSGNRRTHRRILRGVGRPED